MAARLGLGTVQFGLDYGVSNISGRTPLSEVASILETARKAGVCTLDTASAYGDAETVLGNCGASDFKVITKSPPFEASVIREEHARHLCDAFEWSLERMRLERVDGLLLHRAGELFAPGGERLWRAMKGLKEEGRVGKIGVSINHPEEVTTLLDAFDPDLVQLPVNVMDQRLLKGGQLEALRCRGVEVHARSAFLQGLLLMAPEETDDYFRPVRHLLTKWRQAAYSQGLSPFQAALAFVRDLPGVDVVLIGVNGIEQFKQCVEVFDSTPSFSGKGLSCSDSAYISPTNWKLAGC